MNERIKVLKTRYENLFPGDLGVKQEDLDYIEKELGIILPEDFRDIASFYSGGLIGGQSIYTITANFNDDYSIGNRAKVFRETIHLPETILPLYSEHGFIYIDLNDKSKNFRKVIYCGPEDAQNLYQSIYPQHVYWSYLSFTDFFEYLIEQEEQERQGI